MSKEFYNQCVSGAARKGINNAATTASNAKCKCCNTASASTPRDSPYFNFNVRYSENGEIGIPCIDNQTRTLPNARHSVSVPRQVRGKCSVCPGFTPVGDPRAPCDAGGSKFCDSGLGLPPCDATTLGVVTPFEGSRIISTALAGTIAANDYTAIKSSDQCGQVTCPEGTQETTMRKFNRERGTWDFAVMQFQTQQDADAVLGDGFDEPLYLDRDFIAANLVAILGEARLTANGWSQA